MVKVFLVTQDIHRSCFVSFTIHYRNNPILIYRVNVNKINFFSCILCIPFCIFPKSIYIYIYIYIVSKLYYEILNAIRRDFMFGL